MLAGAAIAGAGDAAVHGDPLTAEADRLFRSGMFTAADVCYTAVLALDSDNAHALARRGYPELRRRPATVTDPAALTMPLWFAGDHLLLAHGTINNGEPLLFLVDTGGAGFGFTAPDDTLTAAAIPIPPATASSPSPSPHSPSVPPTAPVLTDSPGPYAYLNIGIDLEIL